MRELADNHRVTPGCGTADGAGLVDEALIAVDVVGRDPQLAADRAAGAHHRDRFEPQQARTAAGKTLVPPPGQLARAAVRLAVDAFHGLDRIAVGQRAARDGDRLGQDRKVVAPRQLDADPVALRPEVVGVGKLEGGELGGLAGRAISFHI